MKRADVVDLGSEKKRHTFLVPVHSATAAAHERGQRLRMLCMQ